MVKLRKKRKYCLFSWENKKIDFDIKFCGKKLDKFVLPIVKDISTIDVKDIIRKSSTFLRVKRTAQEIFINHLTLIL